MGLAIVTGSSRGIGAAIARALARDGFDIAVNYVSNASLAERVVEDCRGFGVQAERFMADVSDYEQCERLLEDARRAFGTPEVLVNNAGRVRDGLLARMTEEQFDSIISANLKSAFNMMRVVTPHMMKARAGRIINITSVAGVSGNAGQVNYSASKAGMIGMTKSASRELGGRGITVNAVAPGFTESDMTGSLSETVRDAALKSVSLRRFAKPEEIADGVSFLASPRASYITGHVLVIDGGLAI